MNIFGENVATVSIIDSNVIRHLFPFPGRIYRVATPEEDCRCSFQREHQHASVVRVPQPSQGYDSSMD